jgi:small subunit ribosomal protein S14
VIQLLAGRLEPLAAGALNNYLLAKGCQIFHSNRGIFVANFDLELAPGRQPVHSSPLFFNHMAKTAWTEREKRKRKTVAKHAELRAELKKKGDYLALAQLPRNASPVRLSNRCRVSGRKRAFIREFQMSRLTFRELACAGLIPGVTKASW